VSVPHYGVRPLIAADHQTTRCSWGAERCCTSRSLGNRR